MVITWFICVCMREGEREKGSVPLGCSAGLTICRSSWPQIHRLTWIHSSGIKDICPQTWLQKDLLLFSSRLSSIRPEAIIIAEGELELWSSCLWFPGLQVCNHLLWIGFFCFCFDKVFLYPRPNLELYANTASVSQVQELLCTAPHPVHSSMCLLATWWLSLYAESHMIELPPKTSGLHIHTHTHKTSELKKE